MRLVNVIQSYLFCNKNVTTKNFIVYFSCEWFISADYDISRVNKWAKVTMIENPNCILILVATKSDLLCKEYYNDENYNFIQYLKEQFPEGFDSYVLTSSLTGSGIDTLLDAAKLYIKDDARKSKSVDLKNEQSEDEKKKENVDSILSPYFGDLIFNY